MRQVHPAGEKTFVNYVGHRPSLVDRATGALVAVADHTIRIKVDIRHQ